MRFPLALCGIASLVFTSFTFAGDEEKPTVIEYTNDDFTRVARDGWRRQIWDVREMNSRTLAHPAQHVRLTRAENHGDSRLQFPNHCVEVVER